MSNKNESQISENSSETEDINKNTLDLSIAIDELLNLILKEINEGKVKKVIKQHVLNYINNQKITNLQEIYQWLLNNQNNLNSAYLLGYFNYHGIETDINMQNAFKLFQKAAKLGNSVAQYDIASMY